MISSILKHYLIPICILITFLGCVGSLSHREQEIKEQELRGPSLFYYPSPFLGIQSFLESVNYPIEALEAGIEGTVVVYAHIDSLGNVTDSMIKDGFPGPALEDSALAVVRRTKWRPAERYRTPLSMWIIIPITFNIKNHDNYEVIGRGFRPVDNLPTPIAGIEELETRINNNPAIKSAGTQGFVLAHVFIDSSGRAVYAYMIGGSHPDFALSLGEVVLEEIRQTPFLPAKQHDIPAGIWYGFRINLLGTEE